MNEEKMREIREKQLRLTNEYEESAKLFGDNEEIDRNILNTKKTLEEGLLPYEGYADELREYIEILELLKRDRSYQDTDTKRSSL